MNRLHDLTSRKCIAQSLVYVRLMVLHPDVTVPLPQ